MIVLRISLFLALAILFNGCICDMILQTTTVQWNELDCPVTFDMTQRTYQRDLWIPEIKSQCVVEGDMVEDRKLYVIVEALPCLHSSGHHFKRGWGLDTGKGWNGYVYETEDEAEGHVTLTIRNCGSEPVSPRIAVMNYL